MNIEVGNLYEKNGYTIVIDIIRDGYIFVRKWKAKIGDVGTIDNFCGAFKMRYDLAVKDLADCKMDN